MRIFCTRCPQSAPRSSRRIFVRVTQGTGNYRYLGDLNNNGLADESEFVLTRFDGDFVAVTVPTDELVPVIDLKTGLRLRFNPARLFPKASTGVEKALSILSGETYVRVDEKSTERDLKQIYLLHFSHFRNDSDDHFRRTVVHAGSLFLRRTAGLLGSVALFGAERTE